MSLRKGAQLLVVGGWIILSFALCVNGFALSEKEESAQSLTHYMMGLIYDWQDEPLGAIEQYQKVKAQDADNFPVRLRLGLDYARTGKLKEAIEEFKNASRLNPQDLQSHYFLALVYTSMKKDAAASQEYEIILKNFSKEEPQNTQILLYLGQLYFQQKKFDEAIAQFRQIIKLEPKNIDALFFLGTLFEVKGSTDEAIGYFKQAISVDPKHSASLNSLGYLYAQQGRNLDEAERLIKLALELEPDNGAYMDSLGWVYFKKVTVNNDSKLLPVAIQQLERANSLLSDPEILAHLGEAYLKNQETIKAKGFWRKSLEMDPSQKELREKLERIEITQ